jgi:hypothetical protein
MSLPSTAIFYDAEHLPLWSRSVNVGWAITPSGMIRVIDDLQRFMSKVDDWHPFNSVEMYGLSFSREEFFRCCTLNRQSYAERTDTDGRWATPSYIELNDHMESRIKQLYTNQENFTSTEV